MFRRTFIPLFALVSLTVAALAREAPPPAPAKPPANWSQAIERFATRVAARHGWDARELKSLLKQARYQKSIIDAMNRPAEGMPWYRYRKIFLQPARIDAGVRFWREHRRLLEQAERKWGVPPHIVTAILGVETYYGRRAGGYRVIDALATLAFAYPKRAAFFARELDEFLQLLHDEGLDPRATLGSYAGAMGMPQFIPSSYRAYAVDFDGDGRRDLLHSSADVIGSVANYFARHGWRPGGPVALKLKPGQVPAAASDELKPSIPLARFSARGVGLPPGVGPRARGAVVALEQPDGVEHWLGFDNFYVITRYNHSKLYAMAVHQLSERIRERMHERQDTASD